jgi:hypothetical protein
MRISAALLSLALIAAQAPPAQGDSEARAVLAALLAHEAAARGPEGGAETCVSALLAGPPTAIGTDDDSMMPPNAVRIRFQWHEAPPAARIRPAPPPFVPGQRRRRPAPEPIPAPPALAAAEAGRLDAARPQAVAATGVAAIRQIDASLVPEPLYLRRGYEDCAALTLSQPLFAGDLAFVEAGFACGGLCGNGSLYALERRDGRWQIVGVADIWIS